MRLATVPCRSQISEKGLLTVAGSGETPVDMDTPFIPDIRSATADPEFLRPSDVFDRYRIKRGQLYRLIESGKVRSVCLRERGKLRGARLVVHDSLRAFIFAHEVTPDQAGA